jgi:4-amino-4-deoxy-L-arabinose transferase-like glycosyltransferase
VQLLALLILPWTVLPFLAILALQIWYAYHPDWRLLWRYELRAILARFLFSVLVPWIIAIYRIRGTLTKSSLPNRQNL